MHQPFVVNKRFAVRMGFTFLLLFGITVHQDSLSRWQQSISKAQGRSKAQTDAKAESRDRSKDVQSEGAIAVQRVKDGCIGIVLTRSNRPARFQASSRVFDPQTFPIDPKLPRFDKAGNPINGVQPMPAGLCVANKFGDTAITSADGTLEEIKRAQGKHLEEFKQFFQE